MDERKEYIFSKSVLRGELKARRSVAARDRNSEHDACKNALPLIGKSALVYIAIGSELKTDALIIELFSRGVKVFAPYTENGIIYPKRLVKLGVADRRGNLPSDCYGINADKPKIECCITPLLGFNERGYRIGYGKGCYDRFFHDDPEIKKIGYAFDCQAVEFTEESHDVPLDCCVTPTNVIYF